ncbi:MAG TPA: hypothetical protein DCS04_05890 [Ruminococcaceae bacterium]|nr:hypothetical protein [Oscillospiraceae bacterium]
MSKRRICGAIFFWIMTAAVMAIIFLFSCEDGEESKEVSENLLGLIIEHLGNIVSHNVLRKIAHFTEYTALGFFMCGAIHFSFEKKRFYVPLIPCALYAVSDEIHQYFVPERACRIFDVFIDTCGSLTGILIFLLIALILTKRKRSRA